jgi:branched-chain amino acid transport system permease protein
MRGYPYVWLLIFAAFMVALFFVPSWGNDQLNVFNNWIIYTIMVVGFYFVFGMAGQFAFSQAAFAMLGGYMSAWATRQGSDWLVAVAFGILIACIVAGVFAYIARKANLFFLAIATLALSFIIEEIIKEWDQLTGQAGGEIGGVHPIQIFGWSVSGPTIDVSHEQQNLFWVVLVGLLIVLLMGIWMARSPVKREAAAMRDQYTVAETIGVPTLRIRISMFVLGSAIGAFAGSLYVHGHRFAQPQEFSVELGLGIFVMLIVGGLESLWGPVLGAAFYLWLPHFLQRLHIELFGHEIREYNQIIYGAVLLLVMIFFPEGLIGIFHRVKAFFRHRAAKSDNRTWLSDFFGITKPPITAESVAPDVDVDVELPRLSAEAQARAAVNGATVEGPAILKAANIRVSFGGVRAVDGVSLDVREGEILGLVGPNGSGKTTFLNALVGVVPASGAYEVAGVPVKLSVPGRSRRLGVLRTYQQPQTYDHLSCIEDVLVSTADHRYTGIFASWFLRPVMLQREHKRWAIAIDALTRVGLGGLAEEPGSRLTYGQRRLLELARSIAGQPRVLLLDEPSAGLDVSETEELSGYLKDLRDEGVSLLVIDHKLDFITGLCDRVAVLELGHLVAVGDAATVFEDQRVVDAYLGVADTDD